MVFEYPVSRLEAPPERRDVDHVNLNVDCLRLLLAFERQKAVYFGFVSPQFLVLLLESV